MNPKLFDLEKIKNTKYGDYFKSITDLSEKQEKIIQNNNIIIEVLNHDHHKNIKQLIIELLGYFKNEQYSSTRIILNNPKLLSRDISISEGIGTHSNSYAYLDKQIEGQIGDTGIFYISDTTKIHTIKFSAGSQFPKTILGISIETKTNRLGIIWFASEDQKVFTKVEADSLIKLAEACACVIQRCIEWNEISFNLGCQINAMNLVNFPLLIISREDVVFSNLVAKKILKLIFEDKNEKEKIIKKIWEIKDDSANQLILNNQNYQIKYLDSIQDYHETYRVVLLVDDTIPQQQINYTSLVLNSINQALRSPLNIVLGSIKMIPLIGETNKQQNDYLITIEKKTNDAIALIEDLMDLDRLIKNNGLRIQKNDINALINKSTELVNHLLKQKRIAIINDQFNSDILIDVDNALFTQALVNILEYAISQSHLGAEIILYASCEGDICKILISDSSNGLSKVDVEKLNSFENIHEVPPSLLLVRRIIEFHQGTFIIQSELGKGNKYAIEIPQQIQAAK
jgi:signal transduction histidine kinase